MSLWRFADFYYGFSLIFEGFSHRSLYFLNCLGFRTKMFSFSLVDKGFPETLISMNMLLFLSNESIIFIFVFFLVYVVELIVKSTFETLSGSFC